MNTINKMNLLKIAIKNLGTTATDAITMGLASSMKDTVKEIKEYTSQCNDALYYMQVKTFLESVDLTDEDIDNFFENNNDNHRLGVEIFKILEATYLEKQAVLLAINFRNYVKGEISKSNFNHYVNLLKRMDAHIFELIDDDLEYSEKLRKQGITEEKKLPATVDDFYMVGVFENTIVSASRELVVFGFIEEEIKDIKINWETTTKPIIKRKRTSLYLKFYLDLYRHL